MSSKPERSLPTDMSLIPAKRRLDRTGRTLEAALELMADGKNWTTGDRRRLRSDGSVEYCALGAISAVTRRRRWSGPFALLRYHRAVARLAKVIQGYRVDPFRVGSTVFTWNDHGYWSRMRGEFVRAIAESERRR